MASLRSNQTTPAKGQNNRDSQGGYPTIVARPTAVPTAVQIEQARLKAVIMEARRNPRDEAPTGEFDRMETDILALLRRLSQKSGEKSSMPYLSLPRQSITEMMVAGPCWRIELHGLIQGTMPLGIDVRGDVIIGRGEDADLDLDPYGAYQQAVSRRHAMLRPTNRQLFLIDLGSTNGTTYNMIPLSRCQSYALHHNDVIALGLLTMTVKIIGGPVGMVPVVREAVVAAV